MKDLINYYYNFNISDIYLMNGKYFFSYNGKKYIFKNCIDSYNNIEVISEVIKQIKTLNPYYHRLVYNKDNSLITIFDNKPFVMLELSFFNRNTISMFDIKGTDYVTINKRMEKLIRTDWSNLWKNKIDYFEEQIINKENESSCVLDSFNYYIGMAENAILYIREASDIINDDILERLVISHKRFYKEMTLLDYYDPTSLIIDYRSRDIAEFLKFSFICKEYDFLLIKDYLYSHKLSRFGAHLLFGRLLFPSFYFDTLEEWLHSNDDGFIRILEERIYEYEMYILEIFSILHDMYNIKEVNWLTKKM